MIFKGSSKRKMISNLQNIQRILLMIGSKRVIDILVNQKLIHPMLTFPNPAMRILTNTTFQLTSQKLEISLITSLMKNKSQVLLFKDQSPNIQSQSFPQKLGKNNLLQATHFRTRSPTKTQLMIKRKQSH